MVVLNHCLYNDSEGPSLIFSAAQLHYTTIFCCIGSLSWRTVIYIADEVYFHFRKMFVKDFFDSIQRHISQYRRDVSSLGCTYVSGMELVFKDETRFQELG